MNWGRMLNRWHDETGPLHALNPDGSPACGARYTYSAGQIDHSHATPKCKRCLAIEGKTQ